MRYIYVLILLISCSPDSGTTGAADEPKESGTDFEYFESAANHYCAQYMNCPDIPVTQEECLGGAYGLYGTTTDSECKQLLLDYMEECSKEPCLKPPFPPACKAVTDVFLSKCF